MFKRIFLTLTFFAAFGMAGFYLTDSADARRWAWRGRPYVSYYYGAPRGNYYGRPYRSYYRSYYYGPRTYRSYYYPDYYYYGPRAGIWVGW